MTLLWKCPQCEESNHTNFHPSTIDCRENKYPSSNELVRWTDNCSVCNKEVAIDFTIIVDLTGVSR